MAGLLIIKQSVAPLQFSDTPPPDAQGFPAVVNTNAHLVSSDGWHHHLDVITNMDDRLSSESSAQLIRKSLGTNQLISLSKISEFFYTHIIASYDALFSPTRVSGITKP